MPATSMTLVDHAVEALGVDPALASALGAAVSTSVLAANSALVFGAGLGAKFPLSVLFMQAIVMLACFVVTLPFNRGAPSTLSMKMFRAATPAAVLWVVCAWTGARVLAAYGITSYTATHAAASLLTVFGEGVLFREAVARLVMCSTIALFFGSIVAASAERSALASGESVPLSAAVHALSLCGFLLACRAAFPPGALAKQRAIHITMIGALLLGIACAVTESSELVSQPASAAEHIAMPLLCGGIARAFATVALLWCLTHTSGATCCLAVTYAALPAIPAAALAIRLFAPALVHAAGDDASPSGLDALGLSGTPRSAVSAIGVCLMVLAGMCFGYSKERQRRLEFLLRGADDAAEETAGLVADGEEMTGLTAGAD